MTIRNDCQGQSGTLALVLVFVLALTSALLIAGIGSLTLQEGQQGAQTERSVQVLTELDSKASLVALEGGDTVTVDMNARGDSGQVRIRDSGRLRLILRTADEETVLTNTTLGTIVYENGNQRVAYQGGGVWRRNTRGNESVMVSPPEVHYRQGTLTLPMINVTGSAQSLTRAKIQKVATYSVYPTDSGRKNPVPEDSELVMYVQSDYYRGWATFFEQRIGGDVEVYDNTQTVRVILRSPPSTFSIDSGLISVGTSDRMAMTGSGNSPTFVDAYNSSLSQPYEEQNRKDTTVRGKGGLKMGGNTQIYGDVDTGGTVVFSGNNNTIYGNVAHQGLEGYDPDNDRNTITGWQNKNGSGVSVPVIDGVVNEKVNTICDGTSSDLEWSSDNTNLSSPYCHSDDLVVQNDEELVFNLSEGNVSLAVEGNLDVKGTIKVKNPGENRAVRLWLAEDEIDMSSAGKIIVEGQRSPAFKLYGASDTYVKMTSDSNFTGLIYAPSTKSAGGGLEMQDSTLYGSAVVGKVTMRSGSSVHYDKALEGFTFDHEGSSAQQLSYLHVTINEVRVKDR